MFTIPVVQDANGVVLPAFNEIVQLDGTNYSLAFRWNATSATWVLDISDTSGSPLICGLVLHVSVPLYRLPALTNIPPGVFMAVDSSGADLDPGLTDLGARVQLFYVTEAEVTGL